MPHACTCHSIRTVHDDATPPSRVPGGRTRRGLLHSGAVLAAGVAVLGSAGQVAASTAPARPRPVGGSGVSLTWLGVAGWVLAFDGRTVLVDPYLSRFDYRFPNGTGIDPSVRLAVDKRAIEAVIGRVIPSAPRHLEPIAL